jgi:hypothetical protein
LRERITRRRSAARPVRPLRRHSTADQVSALDSAPLHALSRQILPGSTQRRAQHADAAQHRVGGNYRCASSHSRRGSACQCWCALAGNDCGCNCSGFISAHIGDDPGCCNTHTPHKPMQGLTCAQANSGKLLLWRYCAYLGVVRSQCLVPSHTKYVNILEVFMCNQAH